MKNSLLLLALFATLSIQAQRFVGIGDYGVDNLEELAVSQLIKSWNPEFIITVGDNNYNDGEASTIDDNIGKYYSEYISPYNGNYGPGGVVNRFFPSPGNHDYNTPNAQPYYDYFTLPGNERYYDVVKGDVHLFSINSAYQEPDGNDENSIQAQWLEAKLAASTAKWKIVYFHVAPFGSAGHGSNDTLQWPFKEWGASAVLAGHIHVYERLIVDGLPYFVIGTGGRPLHNASFQLLESEFIAEKFGALFMEASPTELTFKFIDKDSTVLDVYTLTEGSNNEGFSEVSQIKSGLDDIEENENNGNLYHNSTDLELGYDGLYNQGNQTVGLRFTDIDVPQGAVITRAFIQFVTDGIDTQPAEVLITANLAGNAAPFDINTPYYASNLPQSNSSVSWAIPPWDVIGAAHQSPDLSSLVQEIIDLQTWEASNSMIFLIKGILGTREAEAFEGVQHAAPELLIEYELSTLEQLTVSQINQGTLDAEESETTGALYLNSSDMELGFDSYNQQNYQVAGFRFPNLQIPIGAQITKANIEWTVDATDTEPTTLRLWAEASSNSLSFSNNQSYNLSNRARTSEQLTWSPPAWTQVGSKQQSPDISAMLQEVVNLPGWTPGNSANFFVQGLQGTREAESYEGSPAGAAKLIVYYTGNNVTKDVFASIAHPSDDVEENETNGTVYTSSSDIELGFDPYNQQNYQTAGLRYRNIGIPQGAYILSAYLDFTVDSQTGSIANLTIDADKQANSPVFDDMAFYDVSTRARTAAKVTWQPASWTQIGQIKTSPDLRAIVQELVDQTGWTPGNALSFMIKGTSGTREAESYESGAHLAARLRIQYQDFNPARTQAPQPLAVGPQASPLENLILYPNPVINNGQVKLSFDQGIEGRWMLKIVSVLGQEVYADILDFDDQQDLVEIQLPQIANGSYQLSLSNDAYKRSFRIIVQD